MNISKALKLCRTQKGLTKTKLAELSDISVSYLTLLEQGKRDPNISTINKLCDAFNIPASIFMFLASDTSELEGISNELAAQLSLTALQLIEASSHETDLPPPTSS
ncbi:TPA: helix-turn-helix domain-containing protein [Vibrio vulnificus]|jgi:transcriptional regulator with XRE-family HTH domain|uniref:helix-turn-helix domain-containing protein n=1 Tax=Photobacterium sp. (strain ATCC 43367) TaxID=379097 RepID=UPI00057CF506|nr:helix-turn-helix transcriptional regulator [Vibrio sinaloensis]MCU8344256.1 helix-turn-helix domain-containing protein [Vibrio vulnificus]KHT38506.1 DNA-binding protein [Vibrio sinaloensis]HAS6210517.1 helix-turn-helix domain-containing protein [Vibrio vulnificus]HAS6292700.1 helix-turn-helix domain-containing protein [Vibrio vulnificus]HAS6315839.1 helix-turn-helix domain-containing protein [Vibrio vulnificus]